MRLKYFKKKTLGVFRRNFAAYAGTAVLLSMLVALVFTFVTVREMRLAARENRLSRLRLAADDLEEQLGTMEQIALKVKTTAVYRDSYISRSAYNQVLLIEDFSKFEGYVPYNSEYFLYNRRSMSVFSGHAKYIYPYFSRYYLKLKSDAVLFDILSRAETTVADVIEGRVCVFIPINVNKTLGRENDNVLLFMIPSGEFARRLGVISGLEDDRLTVRWRGKALLGTLTGDEADSAFSGDGAFEVLMRESDDAAYARVNAFYRLLLTFTLLFVLFTLGLAAWAAWRSYLPIRNLMARYRGDNRFPKTADDELDGLVSFMDAALEQSRLSLEALDQYAEALNERNRWLRQQVVLSLLHGEYDDSMRERMAALGIETPHDIYCVFRCESLNGPIGDRFLKIVENMDDENGCFYAARLQRRTELAVLANLSSAEQIPYVRWMLTEAAYAINMQLKARAGAAVSSLKKAPLSFLGACSDESADDGRAPQWESAAGGLYDADELQMTLSCVKSGDEDGAVLHITRLVDSVEARSASTIERLYVHHSIASRLLEYARSIRTTIPESMMSMMLPATEPAEARKDYVEVVRLLCRQAEEAGPGQTKRSEREVLEYIAAHLEDASFNAEQMAEELGMPLRAINRIIRAAAGVTYREYLIRIRIDEAKRLLAETDLSVAEISKKVGYLNIPYFIRAFRADTGYSPGEYRKNIE